METGAATGESPARGNAGGAPPPRPRRHWRRWVGLGVLTLLVGAFFYVRWKFNGPRLARLVAHGVLNAQFQGRTEVESIEWPVSAVLDVRHVDVKLVQVHVYDPDGRLVLWLPEVDANIDAWE